MKILLIEDEKRMSAAVSELLRQEGYTVDVKDEGLGGYDAILQNTYDAVICDVMLPGMNGFEIVKMARGEGISTPVIMLTAKSDITDKVTGLDCGADDYLTKPFQIEELLARLRALIRRNIKDTDGILSAYDLNLNTKSLNLICTTTNKEIRLPEKEFKIMECLISNNGQILSKEQLAMKVWGYNNEAEYNNVEVYISFTRKKLKFLGTKTEIKSIRGMGYELRG
ncbi:MAG: response regulator transcription factor [Pseudobutyrivibrio ruminis]|uniref:response regulator transcription factor n=1 Tax=Pseudobutyrivibrio ruminis TaxID=46206 RepID=UPI0026EF9859|nr:response regulator transcription factor [Pseudobutyrivibrio ruminis]MBE5914141.1 response regulator transcription factor [Pseudobutyrivibrio ruminis]